MSVGIQIFLSKSLIISFSLFLGMFFFLLSVQQSKLAEHLDQSLDGTVHLFISVGGHEGYAHQCVLRSTGRRYDGIDEYSLLKGTLGNLKGTHRVADIERDDGTLGLAYLKAFLTESLEGIVGHSPQPVEYLGLALKNLQAAAGSSSGGGSVGSTEDIGAAVMANPVDDALVGSYESTHRCQRLAEGAHDEVNLLGETEMVANTAAIATEDSHAVSLVNHNGGVVLMLELDYLGQLGKVTLHGEDTVNNYELDSLGLTLLQLLLEVIHIVVLILEIGAQR